MDGRAKTANSNLDGWMNPEITTTGRDRAPPNHCSLIPKCSSRRHEKPNQSNGRKQNKTHLASTLPRPYLQNPNALTALTPSNITTPLGPRNGRLRLYLIVSKPPGGGMSLSHHIHITSVEKLGMGRGWGGLTGGRVVTLHWRGDGRDVVSGVVDASITERKRIGGRKKAG